MARNVNVSGGRPSSAGKKSGKDWLSHQWCRHFEITSRLDWCPVDVARDVLRDIGAVSSYIGAVHLDDYDSSGSAKLPHLHIEVILDKQVRNGTVLRAFSKACRARVPVYADACSSAEADGKDAPPAVLTAPIRSRYCAAVVYLLHQTPEAIREGKTVYDVSALFASDGLDAAAEFERYKAEYDEARATGASLSSLDSEDKDARVVEILRQVESRELGTYNLAARSDFVSWRTTRKLVKDAQCYCDERDAFNGLRTPCRVTWICGAAGAGKTSAAVFMSQDQGYGMPYISSGGSDLFSFYKGQPFVILDDIRPDSIGAGDFIKLINPHYGAAAHSRYNDVTVKASHIVITAPQTPEQWWSLYDNNAAGDIKQLLRRLNGGVWEFVDSSGAFKFYQYDDSGARVSSSSLHLPAAYYNWLNEIRAKLTPAPLLLSKYFADDVVSAPRRLTADDVGGSNVLAEIVQAAIDVFCANRPDMHAEIVRRVDELSERVSAASERSNVDAGNDTPGSVSSETGDSAASERVSGADELPFPESK